MALIQCPECGKDLSTTAPSCPHCGYRQSQEPAKVTTTQGRSGEFLDPAANARGCLRMVAIIFFVIFGLLMIFFMVPQCVSRGRAAEVVQTYPLPAHCAPHDRITRSAQARREFMRQTGYPKGRPGWVVDHVIPLKRGGCDCPANMQWQTREDAKAKDRWE